MIVEIETDFFILKSSKIATMTGCSSCKIELEILWKHLAYTVHNS
jgi:hypothetical protein